jgi:hypothetical protein
VANIWGECMGELAVEISIERRERERERDELSRMKNHQKNHHTWNESVLTRRLGCTPRIRMTSGMHHEQQQ